MRKPSNISGVGEFLRIFPTFVFLKQAYRTGLKLLMLFCLLILSQGIKASETNYQKPDFAFPQTVEKESLTALNEDVVTQDPQLALRYLMNACVAKNEGDDFNSLQENLTLIQSVKPRLRAPYLNLLYLLEADILSQQYSLNPDRYNSRNISSDDISSDPEEWDATIFKEKIYNLVDTATFNLASLSSLPITDISLLVTNAEPAEKIDMTLPEFIAFKGAELLQQFAKTDSYSTIPFFHLSEDNSIEYLCSLKAKELLNTLIGTLAGDNSVVKALAMTQMLFLLNDDRQESYLKECSLKLKNSEGEGIIIYELWNRYGRTSEDPTSYYTLIKNWLTNYTEGYYRSRLENAFSEMSRQRIDVEFPRNVLPGKSFSGSITVTNLEKGYILVYKLDKSQSTIYDEAILKKVSASSKPVAIVELAQQGQQPFSVQKNIEIPGLPEGLYLIVPSVSPTLSKGFLKASSNWNYATVRVTDISLLTSFDSNKEESGKVYVVDALTQKPVEGALVEFFKTSSNKSSGKGVTNSEGWVKVPSGYYRIVATRGKSLARAEAGFSYYPANSSTSRRISILTDLSVYRPGDTIRYALIGWEQENLKNSLSKDAEVEVIMRDANYSEIERSTLKLNNEGRAAGEFVIPGGRLLGNYTLNASYTHYPGQGGGSAFVKVEEYKVPSLQVTVAQVENGENNELQFQGLVSTYSGVPVQNATVKVNIAYLPWRWGYQANGASYTQVLTTDSDGLFTLNLPLENLKGTIFEHGRYALRAEVASEAGDIAESPTLVFNLGTQYEIRPKIYDKIEITADTLKLNVPVYNMASLPEKVLVQYKIKNLNSKETVLEGSFESPILTLSSSLLPSGNYGLEFSTENGEKSYMETILWRKSDKATPYPIPLWLPETEYSYSQEEKEIEITFGGYPDEWILLTLSDNDNILSTEWVMPAEMHHQKIEIPAESPTLFVTLCGMHDFYGLTGVITIRPQSDLNKMEIKALSYRENITAGQEENWTFEIKVGETSAPFANVLAVMSDKALNAIYDFKWNLNIWKPSPYSKYRLTPQWTGTTNSYRNFTSISSIKSPMSLSEMLSWQTYGYSLVSSSGLMFASPALYKSMATRNAMTDSVATAELAEEEKVAEGAVDDAASSIQDQQMELRPMKMPLAFFMPNLRTDKEGILKLNFQVPDFNTTWQLQLAAYNDDLMNATLLLDAVASKPVMVKTNLPQFLRTGDKAQISATIYNNSEDRIPAGGKMILLDPVTGTELDSKEFEPIELNPAEQRVITISFDVPYDLSRIAVRAYGFSDKNKDGEQGFVAILPSSMPVVEATTFYAKSSDDAIEVKLPKLNSEANVTLKYCDNPLWEVLLALPGFNEEADQSALSLSKRIYSNLLSNSIINNNQSIKEGLKRLFDSEDTTLVVSNLEKDQNLKIAQLVGTPWVNDAESETARIASLKKYLDSENALQAINANIDLLSSLQKSDGGFSWFEGMNSSVYITGEVISQLAYLNRNGLLSDKLQEMARKAVKYYDNWLVEKSKKDKELDVLTVMNYLYSRNMLGYSKSKELQKIETQSLDSICKSWRHFQPGQRAKAGFVLSANPKFKATVDTICGSLSETNLKKMPIQDEALILNLLMKYSPASSAIETFKEMLLLQKETIDWNNENGSLEVINTLLNFEGNQNIERELPQIFIGDKELTLPSSQTLTGSYTLSLDVPQVSGKTLRIKRAAGIPAWGGIVSQYVQPAKDVKAEKVENLSVQKKILIEDEKGKAKSASKLQKGDKVIVQLDVYVGKDMEYVVLSDSRSACLQPDAKISRITFIDGLVANQEVGKHKTTFFIERLPAGKYVITYECHVEREGEYTLGITQIQSLYSPAQVVHSAGSILRVQ